jgi:hypothetical protein
MAAPVAEVSDQQLRAAQAAAGTTPTHDAKQVPTAAAILAITTPRVEPTTPIYPAATEISDTVKQALQLSIDNWAMHWSQQDAPAYLNSYSTDFEVPGNLTRSQWQAQRKSRLTSPSFISVSLDYDRFTIVGADEARVTFKQTYKSDRYNDVTQKFLRLKKQDDRWLISAEDSQ